MSNQTNGLNETVSSLIDVIIPVFNCEKYIINAIRSVEQQTLKPKKIIVVDDGSTDTTANLVLNYKSTIPLKYFKKANEGPNSARNTGLKNSTSEYVALLDADDEWYKDKLEKQLKIFKTSELKNLGIVYCKYELIGEKINLNNHKIEFEPTLRGNVFTKIIEGQPVASSASGVLIKKSCFDRVGIFDENLKSIEDGDMWLRLAEHFEFDYVDEVLVKIRRHQENTQNKEFYVFSNEILFLNKWAQKIEDKYIWFYANNLSNTIVSKLFKFHLVDVAKYIRVASNNLTKETKKKLFKKTHGLLSLYLFYRAIERIINKITKSINYVKQRVSNE